MKRFVLLLSISAVTLFHHVLPQVVIEKGCIRDPLYVNEVADALLFLLNQNSSMNCDFSLFRAELSKKNLILIISPAEEKAFFLHLRHKHKLTEELKNQIPLILTLQNAEQAIVSLIPDIIWDENMNSIANTIFAVQKAWHARDESEI